jgi:hypothetical protein
MSSILRRTNPPRIHYRFTDLGWGVQALYIDNSSNLFYSINSVYGFLDTNSKETRIVINNTLFDLSSLNYCFYNNSGITMFVRFPNSPSLAVILNSTYPGSNKFSCNWPISTSGLVTTGCAIFGNTFYVVGSYTGTPNSMTVMQTTLDPSNASNPFGTTTPTFTQTYATFTAASRIYGDHNAFSAVYSGMCAFDTIGNLYITTYGSGVYMYPVGSAFSSTPSLFISSTNRYSNIVYNSVYNVFYLCKVNPTNFSSLSLDLYSNTGALISSNYASNIPLPGTNGVNNALQICCDSLGNLYYGSNVTGLPVIFIADKIVCFKKDTQILTLNGYKLIQDLKKGDLVKTLKHGYVPIHKIGFSEIEHPCVEERTKDQLYKCSPYNYPELFEDLVLTGCHGILVDSFYSEEQEQKAVELNGDLYITDDKYRLPVCLDERATVYEVPGTHTIYHMALEHDDYYMNYGIYANGLLVESTSKRFMDMIKMTLVE